MGDVFLKVLNMSITAGWLILAVMYKSTAFNDKQERLLLLYSYG